MNAGLIFEIIHTRTRTPVNLKLLCYISICLSNEAKLCERNTPAAITLCFAVAVVEPTSIRP